MPQTRGLLNAFGWVRRRLGQTAPGDRLDADAFLAHAVAQAAGVREPAGLWLSLLAEDGAAPALDSGVAEIVPVRAGLAEALTRARAPFVARIGGGSSLAPRALKLIAATLAANPLTYALYTDEIVAEEGQPREVVLKPAFDPVLLDGFDYFGELAVYRRDFALGQGAATAYEWALAAATRAPARTILHLPFPARVGPARAPDAKGAEAVLRRMRGIDAFAPGLAPDRLRPLLCPEPRSWPKVSVVIPSRDAPELLGATLDGLFERTDYPDFDVAVIDNGSSDPRALALYARHAGPRFRADIRPAPFNFSRAVNRGARLTGAPLLLLLNNDVEMVEPGWLKEMVGCLDYPGVGVVGAKLLYPDGALQHAGVIAGLGDYAGHWHVGRPGNEFGMQRRLAARQSLSAVTGACMLISRACFSALGGFDEAAFPVAYNDVDFCLRAGAAGWRVVWTPFARLVHKESATRGSDERPENRARFLREQRALRSRWRTDLLEDRAYNPWAARGHSDGWSAARATLPPARA